LNKFIFLLLLLLFFGHVFAEGPSFKHGETEIQQEFENTYQDIRHALQQINSQTNSAIMVNVKDYGAKGDGTTNDYQAFVAALGSGVKTIFIPPGTYYIDNYFYVPASTTLLGSGMGVTILKHGVNVPLTGVDFISLGNRVALGAYSNIENLTIDGNWPLTDGFQNFEISANYKSVIRNVEIKNFTMRGINVGSFGQDCRVLNCVITGIGDANAYPDQGDGIWGLTASAGSLLRGVLIDGCVISNMKNSAIFASGTGLTISNNLIYGNHCQTAPVGGGQVAVGSATIVGNSIIDGCSAATTGIEENGSSSIIGNKISNNQSYGVFIQNNGHSNVYGNEIKNNALGGVVVAPNVSSFTIVGNDITADLGASQAYGVLVAAGSSNNYVVTGNKITGNTNSFYDSGTGTSKVISGNLDGYAVFSSSIATTATSGPVNIASSGVFQDVLSIPVSTGTYQMSGSATFFVNGATVTAFSIGISTNAGSSTAALMSGYNQIVIGSTMYDLASTQWITIPKYQATFESAKTVYLKVRTTFTAGTPQFSRGNLLVERK